MKTETKERELRVKLSDERVKELETMKTNERIEGHTPGPWRIETELTPDGSDLLVVSHDYELVADCRSGLSHPRTTADCERAEANARLIARAPDLLAENARLKAGLQLADNFIRGNNKRTANGDFCFNWKFEPLEPCDCELCKIRAALNPLKP